MGNGKSRAGVTPPGGAQAGGASVASTKPGVGAAPTAKDVGAVGSKGEAKVVEGRAAGGAIAKGGPKEEEHSSPVPVPARKAALEDFIMLKTVGKGSFGKVVMVSGAGVLSLWRSGGLADLCNCSELCIIRSCVLTSPASYMHAVSEWLCFSCIRARGTWLDSLSPVPIRCHSLRCPPILLLARAHVQNTQALTPAVLWLVVVVVVLAGAQEG